MYWTSLLMIAIMSLSKAHGGEVIDFSLHRLNPPTKSVAADPPRFYPSCTLTLSSETNWRWPSGLMFLATRDDVEVRRTLLALAVTLEPSAAQILHHLMRLVHPPLEDEARTNILVFAPLVPSTPRQVGERARARVEDMRVTLHALDGVLNYKQKQLYAKLLRAIFREL